MFLATQSEGTCREPAVCGEGDGRQRAICTGIASVEQLIQVFVGVLPSHINKSKEESGSIIRAFDVALDVRVEEFEDMMKPRNPHLCIPFPWILGT